MYLHVDSEDSDQSGWMPRLIRVFTGRTEHFVGVVMRLLNYVLNNINRKPGFGGFRSSKTQISLSS